MYKRVLVLAVLCLTVIGFVKAQDQESLSGRLAYIGTDSNVYTYDFATQQTYTLTTDASRTRRYQWPTWSDDGRLAYFCCDTQVARSFDMAGYISATGEEAGRVVYEQNAAPVIYAAWAPAPCDESGACRHLAMLVNDFSAAALRVDLLRDTGDSETIETIATGSPFYYTWSPDATQMVFHRFGAELAVYDVVGKTITRTFESLSPSTFQTPGWSPTDDRILSLIPGTESERSTLTVSDAEQQQTPLRENFSGLLSFLWSPDGRYVAFRQARGSEYGALFVVDATTGEVVARSDIQDVIAFFWSPDSTQVAYITLDVDAGEQASLTSDMLVSYQGRAELDWSVVNVDTGVNRRGPSFLPTSEMIYLMLYFDQFAPSHRVWSPDSRAIVYTETAIPEPLISVYDVQTNERTTLDEGVFAVWSWH
jgi:TolB protein